MSRGTSRAGRGTRPKYFVASSAASRLSMSPAMTTVALVGT